MNVSEYIVDFLSGHGVTDFFGYQGTMIAYFIEAICQNDKVKNHSCYNEQGAAFAACGYAKASSKCAVAYATSGPGALNLISGVADAYYDSVPVIFITGQLNTTEYTDVPDLRQQGFQQTDVVNSMKPLCKYSVMINDENQIEEELEKAWEIANSGRKGPVVLDIPMNIQKTQMPVKSKNNINNIIKKNTDFSFVCDIIDKINTSKRPLLLLGNGIKDKNLAGALINKLNIPVITSMPAIDLIPSDDIRNLGYLGAAYGFRAANIVAYKKTDLIISIGCSMCRRQTGNPEKFAKDAQIIRIDIDETELRRRVHENEISITADAAETIKYFINNDSFIKDFSDWITICNIIKKETEEFNDGCKERIPNSYLKTISDIAKEESVFSIDVGQHQMWSAQSVKMLSGRKIIFSGGHGAMGFALPAAIGAYYGTGLKPVCITGDGAFQMNIQELQWIVRERIPVTIFVMNNQVLGLIRQQQDDFFGSRYFGSSECGGFTSPDFAAIGQAYGIKSFKVTSQEELLQISQAVTGDEPVLIEVMLSCDSKAYPKTYFGQEMYNQKPYIPQELMDRLLAL